MPPPQAVCEFGQNQMLWPWLLASAAAAAAATTTTLVAAIVVLQILMMSLRVIEARASVHLMHEHVGHAKPAFV